MFQNKMTGFAPSIIDNSPPKAIRLALMGLVYSLALGLLAWRFYSSQLHYDSALIGLMAQSFLKGDFHYFFFGNNYMGTLDALFAAPLLYFFGPTSLVVNIWPPFLYLASMVVVHRILDRLFGFWGVLAGLAWMALPPGYGLFFAGEARTHYGLALLLSAVLFLLTLNLWQGKKWKFSSCFAWGLVAGLAFWTNFLSAQVIAPCALFLAYYGWRNKLLTPAMIAGFVSGALLGAAPLIIYNMNNGWPHLGLSGDLRLGPETKIREPLSEMFGTYLLAVLRSGLPVMFGVISPNQRFVTPGTLDFWVYLAVALLAVIGFVGLIMRSRKTEVTLSWLPVAVFAGSVAAVIFTHYGSQVNQARPRYLLWVLFALPFVWAFWGGLLAKKSPWLSLILILGLAVSNVSAYQGFRALWGKPLLDAKGGYYFRHEAKTKERLAGLYEKGITHLYADEKRARNFYPNDSEGAYELSFLADEKPLIVDFTQDKRPQASAQVDASENPAFWWRTLAAQARFLGVKHQVINKEIFHSFAEPENVEKLLSPRGWKVTTLKGKLLHDRLWDANFRTIYVAVNNKKGGEGFVLDMGREEEVAGFSLIPTVFWQVPKNVTVEVAGEDGRFRLLRKISHYRTPFYFSGPHPFLKQRYGRVECYFPVQKIRYMRFTHLGDDGHAWSVQEMLVYGPGKPHSDFCWQKSIELALEEVRKSGIERLYADAWPSAKARLEFGREIWTLTANRFTNVFGSTHPRTDRPLLVDLHQGSGVLVLGREADLAEEVLTNAEVRFIRKACGRFTLFVLEGRKGVEAVPIKAVDSHVDRKSAWKLARGGSFKGRWGSQESQRPGIYLDLDFGKPRDLGWLKLENHNYHADFPRGLKVLVSNDQKKWVEMPVTLAGPIAFSGQVLFLAQGPVSVYRLERHAQARYVRLELDAHDPVWWWSVEKVAAYGPDDKHLAHFNKGIDSKDG
ncbi:discoidin domain-containing protein [Dethiosulfatarculus sandiegensis]|uniref:F5/8 type C domain-containing protein n=1 Tax=Dethiosulfatarculus sandiegensis TaxID=1429043 RepID=A0A0D2JW78_9BACT|nr:discoidin domain-containing protein [Dethiosulfatarculus sandiegensis]KIX13860.1 hypothetical protein X474_11415 [Dethiosulfatarculus sandiegensis]